MKIKDVLSKENIEAARFNFQCCMNNCGILVEITTEMVEEMHVIPSDGNLVSCYPIKDGCNVILEISEYTTNAYICKDILRLGL